MSFSDLGTADAAPSGEAWIRVMNPLYDRLFDDQSEFVENTGKTLAAARIETAPEVYIKNSLGFGCISALVLWLLGTAIGWGLFAFNILGGPSLFGIHIPHPVLLAVIQAIKIPAIILLSGIIFGAIGFNLGFWPKILSAKFTARTRKNEINVLLSDAVSYMYALSMGGLNQLQIMEAMASSDDTYGEVSKEFQSILNETRYFDTDYRTAIQKQINATPSDDLAQFFADMLSILDSGGDMEGFLQEKKRKHMRLSKQHRERNLDTLELMGQMYMTLSLFPLLLIIVLVIMSMMGDDNSMKMAGTVYGLIPLSGLAFLVLISTIKQDGVGDGLLTHTRGSITGETSLRSFPIVEQYSREGALFKKAESREQSYHTRKILKNPHIFFREHPLYTLAFTVPVSVTIIAAAVYTGAAPTSIAGMKEQPVWGTFIYVYLPSYINFIPLTIFSTWKRRHVGGITNNLSDTLRKLSSANDTGQTLLESLKTVERSSSDRLAKEFEIIYTKVVYGTRMRNAFIEFNNKYAIPRVARIVKLITEAQEASENITEVLSTAAQTSENQDDIARQQKAKTRQQVVIILMTSLTLLGVIALLKVKFLDVMAELVQQAGSSGGGGSAAGGGGGSGGPSFGANLDVNLISLLFFHAITLQSIVAGFIAGYIRTANLLSGVKFVLILETISLIVWMSVG